MCESPPWPEFDKVLKQALTTQVARTKAREWSSYLMVRA
jgi:hypothetical protein